MIKRILAFMFGAELVYGESAVEAIDAAITDYYLDGVW